MTPPLRRGEFVTIYWDAGIVDAMVVLAAGDSVILMFAGAVGAGKGTLQASEQPDGSWVGSDGTPLALVRKPVGVWREGA